MLYANTDDGSSALWVLDDEGVVVDNISIYGAERAPILEQINEHYGTSFTGWSDNEIGLRFGDHLPNWNAYEKIEMPERQYFKIQFGNGYVPVKVLDNTYGIYLYRDNSNLIICDSEGTVIESEGMSTNTFVDNYMPKINEKAGLEISTFQSIMQESIPGDFIIGETEDEYDLGYWSIENWQNAEIIS